MKFMPALRQFATFIGVQVNRYRPRQLNPTVIEQQEQNVPAKDAARVVLRRGRSIALAYGADGKMHLRRRARQIRREFGNGVVWRAMPSETRDEWIKPRRVKPWWWI